MWPIFVQRRECTLDLFRNSTNWRITTFVKAGRMLAIVPTDCNMTTDGPFIRSHLPKTLVTFPAKTPKIPIKYPKYLKLKMLFFPPVAGCCVDEEGRPGRRRRRSRRRKERSVTDQESVCAEEGDHYRSDPPPTTTDFSSLWYG